MLRRRNIVEGAIPPSTDSIWLDKGIAKAFINGEWVSIAGGGKDLEEKVDNIQKDLSNYIQSNSSPTFKQVTCNRIVASTPGKGTPVFGQKGGSIDVGSEESFVFTLEDGSKVTKSIRVISTTNS